MSKAQNKKVGLNSIAYRASQLWENVPEEVRNSISLPVFKKSIKKVPSSIKKVPSSKIQ